MIGAIIDMVDAHGAPAANHRHVFHGKTSTERTVENLRACPYIQGIMIVSPAALKPRIQVSASTRIFSYNTEVNHLDAIHSICKDSGYTSICRVEASAQLIPSWYYTAVLDEFFSLPSGRRSLCTKKGSPLRIEVCDFPSLTKMYTEGKGMWDIENVTSVSSDELSQVEIAFEELSLEGLDSVVGLMREGYDITEIAESLK